MSYVTGTQAECRSVQSIQDKAHALPVKGLHIGRGRHVPMTEDPQSPGWTRHLTDIIRHPLRDEHAIAVDSALATDATKRQRLTQRERQDLDAAIASAVDTLPDDWTEETQTTRVR